MAGSGFFTVFANFQNKTLKVKYLHVGIIKIFSKLNLFIIYNKVRTIGTYTVAFLLIISIFLNSDTLSNASSVVYFWLAMPQEPERKETNYSNQYLL